MNREKKLIIISHCILNQNSVVHPCAREMKIFKNFINNALSKNIGIIQLPCPEFLLYGEKRNGHTMEQFDNIFFKTQSKLFLTPIIQQIIEYKENGYKILGCFGIKGSPSCGVNFTCSNSSNDFVKGKGIFMKLFISELLQNNINIDFFDIEDKFNEEFL